MTETGTAINELKINFKLEHAAMVALQEELDARRRELGKQIDAMWAEFGERNAELIESVDKAQKACVEADQALRNRVIEEYHATGVKKIDEHCSVRVNTKLEYDADKATEWSRENAPAVLTIDKKKFEKVADVIKPDFVTTVETVIAVIAKEF